MASKEMDLDNPRWGFIGVAFTLVTAIAGIVIAIIFNTVPQTQLVGIIILLVSVIGIALIYWRFRVVNEIIYQVISDTKVVTVDEEVKDKVQILFKGNPVDDARLLILKIQNVGNTIKSSDYESPFIINFGDDAQILDFTVLGTIPESIKGNVSLEKVSNKVLIKPLLLNHKDSITLKVLTSKAKKVVAVEVRIMGLKQIKSQDEIDQKRLAQLKKLEKPALNAMSYSMLITGISFVLFLFLFVNSSQPNLLLFGEKFAKPFDTQTIAIISLAMLTLSMLLSGSHMIITKYIEKYKSNEKVKFKSRED